MFTILEYIVYISWIKPTNKNFHANKLNAFIPNKHTLPCQKTNTSIPTNKQSFTKKQTLPFQQKTSSYTPINKHFNSNKQAVLYQQTNISMPTKQTLSYQQTHMSMPTNKHLHVNKQTLSYQQQKLYANKQTLTC